MLSDQYELAILLHLRDTSVADGYHHPADVAKAVDLPLWRVRATLSGLRRRHMVSRGGPLEGHFNDVAITERGMLELAAAEQLRIAWPI